MANPLDDFLSGKTDRKPFSMADYEAIPLENRQEYVKNTSMPAKNQASEVLNVEGVVSPKAPVSPTLPKLKEVFSTQPIAVPEQPQQPAYTPPVATSDLVDMEKIRGQVDGVMPERGMSDWLSVLAPLATEAVFGGGKAGGVSYGIAGKAATDIVGKDEARRSKLEDKLMDIERARAIASAKAAAKGQKTYEVDINGQPIITPESQALGKVAWKAPEKPVTGLTFEQRLELEKSKSGLKKQMAEFKQKAAEKKQVQEQEKYYGAERAKDPFTRDTKKVADAYNKLSQLDPDAKDPIQDISVIFDFMKTLDPGSVVRESEQSLVMGAKSVGDFVDNLADMLKRNRKLTPDQVRGIQKFAAVNYQKRLQSQETQIDERYKKISKKYGLDPQVVLEDLSMGTPMLWVDKKTGKTKILSIPKGQEADAEAAGAQRVK